MSSRLMDRGTEERVAREGEAEGLQSLTEQSFVTVHEGHVCGK